MVRRVILLVCICCLFVLGAQYTHAQIVQKYLADKALTATHLSVSIDGEVAPPQSRWRKLWSYVGIRSTRRLKPEIGTTIHVVSSAYASSPYQTDATPCITAAGTTVRPGVVATNFLPLGTIVLIDGEKKIVEDRMAPRFDGFYIDIWFPSTSEALEFGRKKLEITIIGYGKPGDILEELNPQPSVVPVPEKTIWRILTDFLVTKTYSDSNKYDVDCTQ